MFVATFFLGFWLGRESILTILPIVETRTFAGNYSETNRARDEFSVFGRGPTMTVSSRVYSDKVNGFQLSYPEDVSIKEDAAQPSRIILDWNADGENFYDLELPIDVHPVVGFSIGLMGDSMIYYFDPSTHTLKTGDEQLGPDEAVEPISPDKVFSDGTLLFVVVRGDAGWEESTYNFVNEQRGVVVSFRYGKMDYTASESNPSLESLVRSVDKFRNASGDIPKIIESFKFLPTNSNT